MSPRVGARPGAASRSLGRPSPVAVVVLFVCLAALAGIAVLAADIAGGDIHVLRDAGAIARRGAPVAAVVGDLAGALTLGGAVLAGWLLHERADRVRALGLVAIAAGVTTMARGLGLVFSYALATGQSVGSPRFGSDAGVFLGTDLGIWLLAGVIAAAATTTVAALGAGVGIARTVTALTGIVVLCAAMTGHAAGDDTHEVGTSTMLIHLLAVGIWIGGLATLQLLSPRSRDDAAVLRGYSHLALISWIALGLSGVWALWVRMNSLGEVLTSPYVQLGVAKLVLLGALGCIGVLQRRQIEAGLGTASGTDATRTYRRLAILELALMGLAVALAAAMSSSPPPAEVTVPESSPAAVLSGYPLPPAPDLLALLSQWRPAAFHLALACAILLVWWRAAAPQRSRGQNARVLGAITILVIITSGSLNVYGKVLVSAHLVQHLLLLVAVGGLLGSVGTIPGFQRRPPVRIALALAPTLVLITVYATPWLLRPALDGHAAHLGLQVFAILGGAVTVLSIRGAAEHAARPGAGRREQLALWGTAAMPLLLIGAAGVALLLTDALIVASWFGATGRPWRTDALADQRTGGWAVLAIAIIAAAITVVALRRSPGQAGLESRSRTVRRRASSSSRSAKGTSDSAA